MEGKYNPNMEAFYTTRKIQLHRKINICLEDIVKMWQTQKKVTTAEIYDNMRQYCETVLILRL